jgi:hypothetical protein
MLVGMIVPTAISSFFIAGRIISKSLLIKIWGWDDTLIILSWLSSLVVMILLSLNTSYGDGHHIKDVPLQLLDASFKIFITSIIFYQLTLCLTKFSILFFYLRVFPKRRERYLCWGTLACVVCYAIPMFIASVWQCDPQTGSWVFGDADDSCTSFQPLFKASTTLHTVTDAWLIIMVLPVLLSLQLPRRQKYALIAVMGLGVFVITASIARVIVTLYYGDADLTWNLAILDVWTVWECSVSIICACAPTVRPLLLKIFPRFLGSNASATYGDGYTGGVGYTRPEDGARTRAQRHAFELNALGRNNTNSIAFNSSLTQKEIWAFENGSDEAIITKPKEILKSTEYVNTQSIVEVGRAITFEEGQNRMLAS